MEKKIYVDGSYVLNYSIIKNGLAGNACVGKRPTVIIRKPQTTTQSVIRNGAVTIETVRVARRTSYQRCEPNFSLLDVFYPHVDYVRYVFVSEIKRMIFNRLRTRDKIALMLTCKLINKDTDLRRTVAGAKKSWRRTKERVKHKTEIKIAHTAIRN